MNIRDEKLHIQFNINRVFVCSVFQIKLNQNKMDTIGSYKKALKKSFVANENRGSKFHYAVKTGVTDFLEK